MPRLARVDIGGEIYHVLNRVNGRMQIFNTAKDYALFESLMQEAQELTDMQIYAYVLMPNHWHILVSPKKDRDLAHFMHYLCNTHTRRVHTQTKNVGSGHLYQGRYKSFLVDSDKYFLTLLKYIERNPVRAKLTRKVESWKWGSGYRRLEGTSEEKKLLAEIPIDLQRNYRHWVNEADKEEDVDSLRLSVNKGKPFGTMKWIERMVERFKLELTTRAPGRPKKS